MKKALTVIFAVFAAVVLMAQTPAERELFGQRLTEAKTELLKENYARARTVFAEIMESFAAYPELVEATVPSFAECLEALAEAAESAPADRRISVTHPLVTLGHKADSVIVTVEAGGEGKALWTVGEVPDWCDVAAEGNDLTVSAPDNTDATWRYGGIELSYKAGKKTETFLIAVLQKPRPLQQRKVRFVTLPTHARMEIEGDSYQTPFEITLQEGQVPVRISRQDYETIEQTLDISWSDDDAVQEFSYSLVPEFGAFRFTLEASAGRLDDKNPRVFIGKHPVAVDAYYGRARARTFEALGAVAKYTLYKDREGRFIIPVDPGTSFTIWATAEHFNDFVGTFAVEQGETAGLDIRMAPKMGEITFCNAGGAEGATVLDGSTPIATLGSGETTVSLTMDEHRISFLKKDFTTAEPSYSIWPSTSSPKRVEVSMMAMTYLSIYSEPSGASISIDGVPTGEVTPLEDFPLVAGTHTVSLSREGAFPVSAVTQLLAAGSSETVRLEMRGSHLLRIRTDGGDARARKEGYTVTLNERGEGLLDPVNIGPVSTLETLALPYGDYRAEIRNAKGVLAWRGRVRFNEKSGDSIRRLTYTTNGGFAFVSGSWYPLSPKLSVDGASSGMSRFADASIAKFKLFPGFSTSALSATAFVDGQRGLMFKVSPVLLNGELRLGGCLGQYFDASLLGTYAYTPAVHELLGMIDPLKGVTFNYMSGWDAFVGVEIGTRIPVFDAAVRAGYHFGRGSINRPGADGGWETLPYDESGLVVAVGFSIGSARSKGANILRLWY